MNRIFTLIFIKESFLKKKWFPRELFSKKDMIGNHVVLDVAVQKHSMGKVDITLE